MPVFLRNSPIFLFYFLCDNHILSFYGTANLETCLPFWKVKNLYRENHSQNAIVSSFSQGYFQYNSTCESHNIDRRYVKMKKSKNSERTRFVAARRNSDGP